MAINNSQCFMFIELIKCETNWFASYIRAFFGCTKRFEMFLLLSFVLNSIGGTFARFPAMRIIGGQPITIDERPFQVLIFNTVPFRDAGCGGSIIARRWVLTAAHCITYPNPENFYIRVGADKFENDDKALWYRVLQFYPHQGFLNRKQTEIVHDVGLIRIRHKFRYNENIRPIALRKKSPSESGQVVVSGFGATMEFTSQMAPDLRAVSLGVIDRDTCEYLLHLYDPKLSVSETHFCAADLSGGHDACQGDSGGPATIGRLLAGITSWGVGCGEKMMPAFYTDVSKYISWIHDTMKHHRESYAKHQTNTTRTSKNYARMRSRGCARRYDLYPAF